MPRRLQSTDAILDAARDLVASDGPRAATLDAIAAASGATTGSIYHRFPSVDALVAATWLRSRERSVAAWIAAAEIADGPEAVVAAALGVYDFCLRERAEARVLGAIQVAGLLRRPLPAETEAALRDVGARTAPLIADLARACFGRASAAHRDTVLLATTDVPFGCASRYLDLDVDPPATRRVALEAAVRGILAT